LCSMKCRESQMIASTASRLPGGGCRHLFAACAALTGDGAHVCVVGKGQLRFHGHSAGDELGAAALCSSASWSKAPSSTSRRCRRSRRRSELSKQMAESDSGVSPRNTTRDANRKPADLAHMIQGWSHGCESRAWRGGGLTKDLLSDSAGRGAFRICVRCSGRKTREQFRSCR